MTITITKNVPPPQEPTYTIAGITADQVKVLRDVLGDLFGAAGVVTHSLYKELREIAPNRQTPFGTYSPHRY